ncbi:MAG: hypothetical protein HY751_10765 [Nitrospinae bacterium]|nr:hypothetical protein [Nitrospinota bacterium]
MKGKIVHAVITVSDREGVESEEIPFRTTRSSPGYEAYWPTYRIVAQGEIAPVLGPTPLGYRVKAFKGNFTIVEMECGFENDAAVNVLALKNALSRKALEIAKAWDAAAGYEEYTFYCVSDYEGYDGFLSQNGLMISQLIKDETADLAPEEIKETLASSLRYDNEDLTVIEWDGALLLDKDGNFDDNITLLELANIQLLALRTLDNNLSQEIARFKRFGDIKTSNIFRLSSFLKSVVNVRTKSLFELDSIDDAIKLYGDWYSAKVYSIAARKLYHVKWRDAVEKKLNLLENMFEMVSHRQVELYNLILEFSIVALIVFEIALLLAGVA